MPNNVPPPGKPLLAVWPNRLRYFASQNRLFIGATLLLALIGLYFVASGTTGDVVLAVNGRRTAGRDAFFIFFTQFAEPLAYIVIALLLCLLRYRTAIFSIACGVLAGLVSGGLKNVFGHARPLRYLYDNAIDRWGQLQLFDPELYNNSWAYTSFPSGHAMSAFALYGFLAFNANRGKLGVATLCFVLASLVAFSRMYLLMHFLRDILVGGVLGLFLGVFLFWAQFRVWPERTGLDRGLLRK